jgi:BlaI family transcriptional regulator, penicillinase repressor
MIYLTLMSDGVSDAAFRDRSMVNRIRVTDAQFAILEQLWLHGAQTIRQVMAPLYPTQTKSDYATVQKLLEQLKEKGCVQLDRSKTPHVFSAAIERGDLIDAQLKEMADRLCDGSLTPLLMHLVADAQLSKHDRATLRRLLDEAKQRKKTPGGLDP